jgi:SEC-C motif-containing protein
MPIEANQPCPCGHTASSNPNSPLSYEDCCAPLHRGERQATTAERLMRARYSAHAAGAIDYLMDTWWPQARAQVDATQVRQWAQQNEWRQLVIHATTKGSHNDTEGWVEFSAYFLDKSKGLKGPQGHELQCHREHSNFRKLDGRWYFVDGEYPKADKVGRNDPCPCGSGRKFKRCCGP